MGWLGSDRLTPADAATSFSLLLLFKSDRRPIESDLPHPNSRIIPAPAGDRARELKLRSQDIISFGNNVIFRYLFGWLMPPEVSLLKLTQPEAVGRLYDRAHVIQDMLVPIQTLERAIQLFHDKFRVYPIWLCPFKVPNNPGQLRVSGDWQMFVDIGVYGVPKAPGFETVDFDELLPLPGLDTSGNVYGHELIPLLVPEPIQCTEPLGLAADLPLESIEVSSNNQDRKYFALTAERGWRPLYSTPGEWIMFDFTSPRNITGVKTKGGVNGWVTTYNIMYTSDLTTFNPVIDDSGATKIFPANFDKDSVVVNEFRPPIHARYLKVLPLKWKDAIEMRVEPIGCFEPYPTATVAPTQSPLQPTTEACVLCPGIPATSCDCHNATAKYFDGDSCVSRDQCPCVEGFMTYAVGSAFRGLNCDECVCKLGGVTDCKPVKECACDQRCQLGGHPARASRVERVIARRTRTLAYSRATKLHSLLAARPLVSSYSLCSLLAHRRRWDKCHSH
ncbi:hypothetical protein MSG28_003152 [Choristoneura fumiferana]|uniref:Uncharacterized protein n=1 Tax=Choristoneura fumiferana TaxID=7141 RepID=A0ACC0KEH9_CHOFU|nr:hypothetical protein MSG28_003152 [Choristoneura fumiferana]